MKWFRELQNRLKIAHGVSCSSIVLHSETQVLTYLCPTSNIELKDNTVIVVLGASGDLAKKKTVSSSEKLYQELY